MEGMRSSDGKLKLDWETVDGLYNSTVREPEWGAAGKLSLHGLPRPSSGQNRNQNTCPRLTTETVFSSEETSDVERSLDQTTSGRSNRRYTGRAYFVE